ncbi:hypothetical protein B5M44_10605 [Shinella sumterensis]|nr:hypothetical protein B5M44_10605 [Shinella sumterensis]
MAPSAAAAQLIHVGSSLLVYFPVRIEQSLALRWLCLDAPGILVIGDPAWAWSSPSSRRRLAVLRIGLLPRFGETVRIKGSRDAGSHHIPGAVGNRRGRQLGRGVVKLCWNIVSPVPIGVRLEEDVLEQGPVGIKEIGFRDRMRGHVMPLLRNLDVVLSLPEGPSDDGEIGFTTSEMQTVLTDSEL